MDRLQKKREGVRESIAKFIGRIETELEEKPEDLEYFGVLLAELNRKETSLIKLDEEIEEHVPLEKIKEEISETEEYREKITMIKSRLEQCNERQRHSHHSSQENIRCSTGKPNLKLPRLTISKFYGESSNWQSFWAQYETSIHENDSLSKVDKFVYLKSLIGGIANTAISGLSLTEHNYDAAIGILTSRFGRRDIVVNAHMNVLLNLPPVRKSNDLRALRKMYDTCEVQIRSLESLGIVSESYSALLYPIIMKLIPPDIALEISRRRVNNENWDLTELLNLLRQELENRERTLQFTRGTETVSEIDRDNFSKKKERDVQRQDGGNKQNRVPTAATLTSTVQCPCMFCKESDHGAETCKNKAVSEKKEILRKQGRCFRCLKPNHLARTCRARVQCTECNRRHYSSLCENESEVERIGKNETENATTVVASLVPNTSKNDNIYLQTVQAKVRNAGTENIVRCLLDSGSERSFIREDLSRKLKLEVIGTEKLTIHAFGNSKLEAREYNRVKISLCNKNEPENYIEIEALEIPEICDNVIQVTSKELSTELKFRNLIASDEHNSLNATGQIGMIIGTDNYWDIVTGKIERLGNSLVAMETLFGWAIHGVATVKTKGEVRKNTLTLRIHVEPLPHDEEELASFQLKRFWDLEQMGVRENENMCGETDQKVLDLFESTLTHTGERYRVALPWKTDAKDNLQDNLSLAQSRFRNLVQKFVRYPVLYTKYKEVIDNYLETGVVERVQIETDPKNQEKPLHFLPHRAVLKEDRSTTKLRIVFDASAKQKEGVSLNDCLHTGPNLNPDLFELLIRFRTYQIAFCADIEAAFLQIELSLDDRRAACFLWTDNPFVRKEKLKFETLRLTRVLFGVSSSPFLLAATIKHHLKKYENDFPETCEMLDKMLYVDDVIGGSFNEHEADKRYQESKAILKEAGMNLRKWKTNSKLLQEKWEKHGNENDNSNLHILEPLNVSKVLGIGWNTEKDTIFFDFSRLIDFLLTRKDTKRFVLQTSGRVFDPVGMLSPFTLIVKLIFQDLWSANVEWDEKLPETIQQKWEYWCNELQNIKNVEFPRYHFYRTLNLRLCTLQLHGFGDASERAYGTVLYLRAEYEDGTVITNFVCSKNKVAPLKTLTLPRLELMGAMLTAKLCERVRKYFQEDMQTFHWTDSTIVYFWINGNPGKYKPFVENRLREIRKLSKPCDWHHCPGKINPADLPSRGSGIQELLNGNWYEGPSWLRNEPKNWPTGPENKGFEETDQVEVRSKYIDEMTVMPAIISDEVIPSAIFKLEKFSAFGRALRVTSWILRFTKNSRLTENERNSGVLSTGELRDAENYWLRTHQFEQYPQEYYALLTGHPVSSTSQLYALNPYMDDENIMRVRGRIQRSTLPNEQKHPIIVNGSSVLAKLLINRAHFAVMHDGVAHTLSLLREKYWITRGRQTVRKVIRECLICKRFFVKPGDQQTAPLPKERLHETPAFQVSAVDFAGPLYTRISKGKLEKSYIALFTCATTRAVHLELVSNLSIDNFLLALKRFLSRRGPCYTIFSDNAKTFKGAEKELKEIYEITRNEKTRDFLVTKGITWKYIVERAPFWGGFWERLVRSTKSCLKRVLGKALLNFEELATLLCEIEAVLNSRPLTYVYDQPNEPQPLTPSHFLTGTPLIINTTTQPKFNNLTSTRNDLTRRLKYRQVLLRNVWNRWRNLYLADLRSAHFLTQPRVKEDFREGQVVLLESDSKNAKNKMLWKLAVIVETFKGRDSKIRACAVRLSDGTILRRPVQLLYRLEIEKDTNQQK